jgi:SNF2 family DNA or RNA helicase
LIIADIDTTHPNHISLHDVPFNMKDTCNKVPGLLWDKKAGSNTWRVSLGWASYLALLNTFKTAISVGPGLQEWIEYETKNRIDPALYWKTQEDAPGIEGLYPFQRVGVQFMTTAKRVLNCDDMGLGKTREAIATVMQHYINGTDPFPILVVAPNTTKKSWKREFEEVWPGLEVTIIGGSITQRRKQFKDPAHVLIINWEALRSHSRLAPFGSVALRKCEEHGGKDPKITPAKCHVHPGELNAINFKTVIGDEIHKAKDGASQQTRALKAATGDADIRIGLTGTPVAKSLVDLWSILNWLSPEEWPSKTRYIDRFVEISRDMWGYETVIGFLPGMKEEFFQAFDPRMIRRTKESVLSQLPPIVYERRDVLMNPKQKKAYVQMRDQMIAELEGNSDTLVVTNAMVKIGRLLQFASSYAEAEVESYLDEETGELKYKTKVTLINPSNKVDAFMDDLPDFEGRQVVVFAASRQLIELLSERLEKKGIEHGLITGKIDMDERQVNIDRFQNGEFQYMLVTTGAGGTGLTLTAANTAVFLQRPWSIVDSQQSEARVRRIGSEIHDKITIIDYVSTGTADETVLEALNKKDNMLQIILRDKDRFRREFLI